jgi:hypothetical protein
MGGYIGGGCGGGEKGGKKGGKKGNPFHFLLNFHALLTYAIFR